MRQRVSWPKGRGTYAEDSDDSMYAHVAELGLEASIVEAPHRLLKDKIPEGVAEACKLVLEKGMRLHRE